MGLLEELVIHGFVRDTIMKAKSVSVLASFSDLIAISLHRLCEHCTRFAYFNFFSWKLAALLVSTLIRDSG